jgi:hypothetical protein
MMKRRDMDRSTGLQGSKRRVLVACVLILALAPVLAVLVTRIGRPYFPMGDTASTDLMVRDVFTAHTPLVGAYSRGFNHPGPWLFWLLAPLSVVTGRAPWATMVGGALLQGLAIGGVAWVAYRRAGYWFMLVMLAALALIYIALGPAVFLEAWNPYVAVPFFVLFFLQVLALAEGSRWQLVGAVITGSLVVQFHIGYAPLVGAAFLWAASLLLVRSRRGSVGTDPARRGGEQPSWAKVGWCTVPALAVLWIPTVVQQLTGDRGNLRAIGAFFFDGGAPAGLKAGAGLLAAEFRVVPPWLGGHDLADDFTFGVVKPASVLWLLIPVVLIALGLFAAKRTGRRADRHMIELASLMCVVGVISMSRITLEFDDYLFFWRITVAVLLVASCGIAIAHWLRIADRPGLRVAAAAVLIAIIAVGFVKKTVNVIDLRHQTANVEAVGRDLAHQVGKKQGAERGAILVRSIGPTWLGVDQGLINELARRGVDVRVDPRYGYHFGEQRVATQRDAGQVWYVVDDGSALARVAKYPGARVIARWHPLDPSDEAELTRLQSKVGAALSAAGETHLVDIIDSPLFAYVLGANLPAGVSQAEVDRLTDLNEKVSATKTCRCGVVAFPAATAPELPYSLG